jgi:serine/threonine protein kinase
VPEKRLVVKRLLPEHTRSERLRTMFVQEAHLAMRLEHPNLVHVYELVEHPTEGLLLAMEYVEGADLGRVFAELVRDHQRLPLGVVLRIIEQAARGLHHAHERRDEKGQPLGIIHRDISPQNILVSRDGVVKVGDLGVARTVLFRDATGVHPGKPRYMSPEQAAGWPIDRRADVYALGVVMYEALRLVTPYGSARDMRLLRAVREGRFSPPLHALPDVPEDVAHVLRGALATDAGERLPTARALADAITQVQMSRGLVVDDAEVERVLGPIFESIDARTPIMPFVSTTGHSTAGASAQTPDSETTPAPPSSSVPTLGERFDRYVLEERIGHGGMADVYRARDTKLGREVAIKLLRPDSAGASRERLIFEAQAAATFQHPSSVVIYDVGEHDDVPFIAMELIPGRRFLDLIGDASIPLPRRIRYLCKIARVLAAAHRAGLVHRDVKPSNVMLRDDGEVKVLDFGVARRSVPTPEGNAAAPLTATGSVVGTPGYAAPEQLRGEQVDGRADQFGWGITAYELLSGKRAYDTDATAALMYRTLYQPLPPLETIAPHVPADVSAVVSRALSLAVEDRFASIDEAADVLEDFAEIEASSRASRPSFPGFTASGQPWDPSGPSQPVLAATVPDPVAPIRQRTPYRLPVDRGPRAVRPSHDARGLRLKWWLPAFAAAALIGGAATWLLLRDGSSRSVTDGPQLPVPVVASLGCARAEVQGEPDPLIADALGRGACARLGVALGVPWSRADAASTVRVRAQFEPAGVTITLSLDAVEATAQKPLALRALDAAVAALAPKLAAAPLGALEIKRWGADDDAGARRIARVFHRRDLRLASDIASEALHLGETDPSSPFSHLLPIMVTAGSGDHMRADKERTLALLDRVPSSRATMIRGLLLLYPSEADRPLALRLMRQAYLEAPDDPEMAGLYAIMAIRQGLPEAFPIVDKLVEAMPEQAVTVLENAIERPPEDVPERRRRYAAKLLEILPEQRATPVIVRHFLRETHIDEARAALAFGERLGYATGDLLLTKAALIDIELTAGNPALARDVARLLMADGRHYARMEGVDALATSYFIEGRPKDGLAAYSEGMRLGIDGGDPDSGRVLARALAARRWLHRGPEDPALVRWAQQKADSATGLRADRAFVLSEIALATPGEAGRALQRTTLRAIEDEADAAADAYARDPLLVASVPLVRALRGDRAAAERWRNAVHARSLFRLCGAIDAALALEAVGDSDGAERAYRVALDPVVVRQSGAAHIIAWVRLARLLAAAGRSADAAAIEREIAQRFTAAEPGFRAAIERLR